MVGDAPGDVGDLPAVDLRSELEQAVCHCHRRHDDRVGGSRGLAQDAELIAVGLGEDQVGAVNQSDAGMQGQGSDQGWGGAEGQVLKVQDADLGWVDRGRERPA